jgi:hypothetical protein
MPRTPLLLLLVLAGVALASCGKGGTSTVTVEASGAASGSSNGSGGSGSNGSGPDGSGGGPLGGGGKGGQAKPPAGKSPSRERALAFAQAVNLTADDVPGFTAKTKHDSDSAREKKLGRELAQCTGAKGLSPGEATFPGEGKAVADESSKDFELKHGVIDFSVSSGVSVQSSAAGARQGLQAIRSPQVRKCFSHYLQLLFAGQHVKGATPGPVSIQAGIPPAPGTSGGFGWRITASFTIRGIKVPIYLDFLGFVDGPAEVTLLSSGLLRPFPAEVQQRLFAMLLARAKAHEL